MDLTQSQKHSWRLKYTQDTRNHLLMNSQKFQENFSCHIGGKEIIFNSSNSFRRMSYFSIATTKHHDKGKKKPNPFNLGAHGSRERVHDHQGGGHVGIGMVLEQYLRAESLHLIH